MSATAQQVETGAWAGGRERRAIDRRVFIRWVTIAVLLTWLVLPMVPLLIWSFSFRWFFPDVLPSQYSLRAWNYVFSPTSGVLQSLWDTILISAGATALSILVGVPAGRALGQYRFRGKTLVELLILAPTIVPGIAVVLGIHVLFIRYGLANTAFGVMLVHLIPTLPYMVLVMSGVFANYGTELEDTARTLGAGRIRVFLQITLPAIRPGLSVALMFTFLISWGQYLPTLLIGSGRITTLPLVLFPLLSGPNKANAAAVSLVFIAPALLALVFTSRQLGRDSTTLGGFGRL